MVREFQNKKEWALILGGSSGLGLASAKKLAKHGMNICIVHRDTRVKRRNIDKDFKEIAENSKGFISYNVDALNAEKRVSVIKSLKTELEGNKVSFHIELENIGENEEAQSILWKAAKTLGHLTNKRWILSITNKSGFKSLSEIEQFNYERKVEQIKKEDSIKKILDIIPSSEVTSVKEIEKENIKNKEKK